ncbi:MAG: sialate O-acetylesterase [Verrucomicrobiota bacterium]
MRTTCALPLRRFAGLCLALASLATTTLRAEVKLPSLFADHMVLQQDKALPVWGWASPGENVTVTLGGQSKSTTAGADGKWSVKLEPVKTGAPLTLTVKGNNSITINDVLVGEVWLCSGQSNMAMTVNRAKDYEQEQAAAKFPLIRMFIVSSAHAVTPQAECAGKWVVCAPDTVGTFSATAYFFGREVHQKLGVPVGLINSSVGGTAIEAWTSIDVQKNRADIRPILERWEKAQVEYVPATAEEQYQTALARHKEAVAKAKVAKTKAPRAPQKPVEPRTDRNHPSNLYNGKIAPLIPYALRGAIWYQGENNAARGFPDLYRIQLPLLIKDWRDRWGQGDFPFAWVQLPNYRRRATDPGAPSDWAVLRESMVVSLKTPNTGMAITIDIGEEGDIHPKNKQDVGRRLAMWALSKVYGRPGESCGPLYKSHQIKGDKVTVTFDHADGLTAKGGDVKGFAIAGADKKWHWAQAKINGSKVIVSSPDVKAPVAIRYAWADNPDCNLYNAAGLPASTFRTDDWK